MQLKDMFKKETIILNLDGKDRDDLILKVSEKLLSLKLIKDKNIFVKEILKREDQDSTGMGDGIAIPHILNEVVNESRIVFVRSKNKLDWKSMDDQPVDLIFFIMTNGKDGNEHLEALGNLSGILVNSDNVAKLRSAKKEEEVIEVFGVKKETNTKPKVNSEGHFDIVGITACPTGIAHTYLAQEKIEEYARKMGLTAKIETQGRRGTENKLSQQDVDNAKVIFLAHDKAIQGMGRFNGKKAIDTHTKDAIFKGEEIIKNALEGKGLQIIKASSKSDDDGDTDLSLKKFKDIKGNLLAGVSRMLPFVVAGGIILGIGFLIDFAAGTQGGSDFGTINPVAGWFSALGKLSMSMMIPILAGYIAYTIVGPQGLMPGVLAGLASSNIMSFAYGTDGSWANLWGKLLPFDSHESGFVGAIFGAYIAAFLVFGWTKAFERLPKGLQGVRDIVLIPILSLLTTGISMFVVNIPLGYLMMELGNGITWLANHNLLLLVSALFGFMMCVDMGGPINKIAYSLGVLAVGGTLITPQISGHPTSTELGTQQILMASSLLGGMIPPIMIAMCTVIFPRAWSAKDRDAAKVNWVMGACFITEGAIPFMIKDPKRIAASAMTGGLLSGLLVGALKLSVGAPHGGVFVFPLMKTGLGNPEFNSNATSIGLGVAFAFAILIGCSLLSAIILGFWRTADIKKGKLALEESNGVKEGYQTKINHVNSKLSENPKNIEALKKHLGVLEQKITKYNAYEEQLKIKQVSYMQLKAEKAAKKAETKAMKRK